MSWEQKLAALSALAECNLKMLKPGQWIVHQSVEVGGDGFLRSICGRGLSPEHAVEDHWSQATNIPSDRYLAIGGHAETRKQVRWNGFMWADAK